MNASVQSRRGLLIGGFALVALYAIITWLSHDFGDPSVTLQQRPVVAVVSLFSLAFCVYLFAVYKFALGLKSEPFSFASVPTIVVFAIAMRVIVLFSTPILEIDLYRYVWDGNATLAGVSPYDYSPQQVFQAAQQHGNVAPELTVTPELEKLGDLVNASPSLHSILSTIHFGYLPSPYPPVSQAVFAVSAALTPDHASVSTHLLVMRLLIVLFDFGTLWIVILLLRALNLPQGWAIAYGWCPLVIKEFANSGHLDSITVFFTALAALFALRQTKWAVPISAFVLGLATAGKFYPVVLVPVFLVAWMRLPSASSTRWRQGVLGIIVYAATVLFLLYPMLRESTSTTELVGGENRSDGLHVFVRYFEMNDFLFLLTVENLKPPDLATTSKPPWFVVVPESVRLHIVSAGESMGISRGEVPFLLARFISVVVFGLIVVWLCRKLWGSRTRACFLDCCFASLAWVWFLAPTLNPWYWTWALAFIPFATNRAWLWISGLTMIYYLRFWFEYHYTGVNVFGTRYQGTEFFDYVVTWIEFGPWFVCFIILGAYRLRSKSVKSPG